MTVVLYMLGLMIYSYFEGITEAMTYQQVVIRCLQREMDRDKMLIERYKPPKKQVRRRKI